MQRLASVVERLLGVPIVAVVVRVVEVYGRAAGGLLAHGLAFTALFAAVPTVLLMLGVAGILLDDPEAQVRVVAALTDAFPPLEPLFSELLGAVVSGSAVTSLLGLVGLLWAVSQSYVALDTAFARLFVDEPERDPLRRTLRGFAWVAVIVLLLALTVVASTVVAFVDTLLPGGVVSTDTLIAIARSPLTAIVVATVGLAIAYRVLPPSPPSWRALLPPAVVVALVVVALTQAFTFIAPRLVSAAALAGSLAAGFTALTWLSFSFQAVLLGAAWVAVRVGRPLPPKASDHASETE